MEWVLRSPQMHSTFGSLGHAHGGGYHINDDCDSALESILQNLLIEDKYLRAYRRSISFGQNVKKDLLPLLINAKKDNTIALLVRILASLTIPIECLISMDVISKTDFGRQTIFEINKLLASTKEAFTDQRTTKVVIEFIKKNLQIEPQKKLSPEQCTNISNSLLLLRNILHIPEDNNGASPNHNVHNQILWNIFSQSIDKMLVKLITIPEASNWAVTMVQLIALLYKDQHVVTLHKLLNVWLEASLSDSSEDNESNTTPPDRAGSEDSSPMLTWDPTSDSSDTGESAKCAASSSPDNNTWSGEDKCEITETLEHIARENNCQMDEGQSSDKSISDQTPDTSLTSDRSPTCSKIDQKVISEPSDCGYGTQVDNQGSVSTSSNEDELPVAKPVRPKPPNPKQRVNKKPLNVTLQDRKRKRIVKRGKANILNVQGLSHNTPTDDDISNVLKEFTVDFLLKGYNSLVQTLHSQILTNIKLEIDTSHFFWLITYFLKFATQIELDLEHVCSVLSFDIVSYLTAEGVNLCEQFELAIKLGGNDLKPRIKRMHLMVTAIREFVQAVDVYKKMPHICAEDKRHLVKLQTKICETEELRYLLVLLLRHYNPKYHSKQYLQDLVVTNHILLVFVDSVIKMPEYSGGTSMIDHIKQFATPDIMHQYGLLLEDYTVNGEFVNDCVFTMMHHVGGEMGSLICLYQPNILRTFTSIWKSEFEICDDWSDLIEYVVNTFITKPRTLQSAVTFRLDTESFDDDMQLAPKPLPQIKHELDESKPSSVSSNSSKERWTDEELSSLSWKYMQCNASADIIGEMIKLFKDDGVTKTRESLTKQLFKQNLINIEQYEKYLRGTDTAPSHMNKEMRDDEIGKLCEQLRQDGKYKFLEWLQNVLLDTCFAKIHLEKKRYKHSDSIESMDNFKMMHFAVFKKSCDLPVMSSVSYHSLLLNQSIPLVPWNSEQASVCKNLKYLQLLHKLGFQMPVDTGKVFIRIPHFWTADQLYEVAGKISPIDTSKLKFSIDDISDSSVVTSKLSNMSEELTKDIDLIVAPDKLYQVHKHNHLATMVNFTPTPGSSFNLDSIVKPEEEIKENWLEVVKKSQEREILLNLECCDTTSVASDCTRMYVSDEDEKPEHLIMPIVVASKAMEDMCCSDSDNETVEKRPRMDSKS